ncbi:hypothetical protein NA57DRAFT_78611 [Rhizodiscina lignyota]|uniref:Uncharacterized protein n=1 Tax=Rhizodiscina lignyota TaxID=1504668 RepID=A0A9P4M3K6_9PEZI|nr:hypothetical protein NA57DRAFT_78611 [Rhizodiscina lignyota]
MFTKTFISLAVLAASVAAAPLELIERQDAPATVFMTPFKQVGCLQSENPHSTEKPESFNVTSGTCFTPDYAFQSYVESTNFNPSTTPCALSIFPEPSCGGDAAAATLTSFGECVPNQSGQSFQLNCGP